MLILLILFQLSANVCNTVEDLFDDPLTNIENLEIAYSSLEAMYVSVYKKDPNVVPEVHKIKQMIEQLTEDVINESASESQIRRKSAVAREQIVHLQEVMRTEVRRRETLDFDTLIHEPILVESNRVYSVGERSGNLKVSFSDAVVRELFWNTIHLRASTHFLRALTHGHSRGRGTDGIIRLNSTKHHEVYELKIVGRDGGQRLFGYMRDGHLRFLVYKDHHVASTNAENAIRESLVNKIPNDLTIRVR